MCTTSQSWPGSLTSANARTGSNQYADRSKAKKALILGSINLAREGHTFSLRPHATVFQVEICAIKAYVLWNIERATHIGKASNYESQPPYLSLLPPAAK